MTAKKDKLKCSNTSSARDQQYHTVFKDICL